MKNYARGLGLAVSISIFLIALTVYSYFERSDRFLLFFSMALVFIVFTLIGAFVGMMVRKNVDKRSPSEIVGRMGILIGVVLLVIFVVLFITTGNLILIAPIGVAVYIVLWYSFNPRYKR
jgi:hypothetical protein